MKFSGHLYEVTQFAPFVRSYLIGASQPDANSIRPRGNAHIMLCRYDKAGSHSRTLVESKTDETGRFELHVSTRPDTSLFLFASGPDDATERSIGHTQRSGCCYRSSPFVPGAIDGHPRNIYVARLAIPSESGFSQAELAAVLSETRQQVADLEWITGTISPDGIALSCGGKGARASGRLVLNPDLSGDLSKILCHSIEDFQLELPGPSWLVGLVVSRDTIEADIRAGLHDLASEINKRLGLRAMALFTHQTPPTDSAPANRLADETTLSLGRLRYTQMSRDGASAIHCTITGEAWLGFPRTFESGDARR